MNYFNQPPHNPYRNTIAPQIHVRSNRGHEQLHVTKLVLRETNTYHDQVYRPFQTQINQTAIENFQGACEDTYTVTPGNVAKFANSIVMPATASGGFVPIADGWNTRRFIFLLEIEVTRFAGTTELIILSGYTDFLGASRSGVVAPDMRLYFNNCIKVNRTQDNMGTGIQLVNRISDVSQVLYDNPFVDLRGFNRGNPHGDIITMRPNDLFQRMQANALPGVVRDERNGVVNAIEPVKFSKASNSNATNYISSVVSNLKRAIQQDSHSEWTTMLSTAQGFVPETKCRTDHVFRIFKDSTDFNIGKSVQMQDLIALSPTVTSDSVCSIILNGNDTGINGHDTEHWTGSTYETIFASTLAHSVPAIMMECMLRSVDFIAHNDTPDCSWVIMINGMPHAFSQGINLQTWLDVWQHRMKVEVLNSLLPDYYAPLSIRISCDIIRDTYMYISYNYGPEVPFLNPSFANALTSPLVTKNDNDLQNITADMESLCTAVGLNEDLERGNHHGFTPGL